MPITFTFGPVAIVGITILMFLVGRILSKTKIDDNYQGYVLPGVFLLSLAIVHSLMLMTVLGTIGFVIYLFVWKKAKKTLTDNAPK